MSEMAPIVLFVYNRPEHTLQVINALKLNKEIGGSELFIFSDGVKEGADDSAVKQVRRFISEIDCHHEKGVDEEANGLGKRFSLEEQDGDNEGELPKIIDH